MRIRQALLIVAASLLCAAGAAGQNLSNMVRVAYSMDPAPRPVATNESASPLVGLVVLLSYPYAPGQAKGIVWYDPAIYLTQVRHLERGHSSPLLGSISAEDAPYLRPYVVAAEFEDGTAVGDPRWLRELHARREAAYKEIDTVTAMLDQALAQHESDAQILSTLEAIRRGVLDNWHHDLQARLTASLVIIVAERSLEPTPAKGKAVDPQTTIPAVVLPLLSRWHATLRRYDPGVN